MRFLIIWLALTCLQTPTLAWARQPVPYVVVPVQGDFGVSILATGIEEALRAAKSKRIKHAVFVFDTPGGLVEDADAIVEVMRELDAEFTYHAVLGEAYSAAIWMLAQCDYIFVTAEGRTGAAVAYSWAHDTGSAEVDAKFNAALAAKISAFAQSKGHNGLLFEAMILPHLEVYLGLDEQQRPRLSRTRLAPDDARIDDSGSVLAMSPELLTATGLAHATRIDSPQSIGTALGIEGWMEVRNLGRTMVRRAESRFQKLANEIENAEAEIGRSTRKAQSQAAMVPSMRRSAEQADPSHITLYYDRHTGMLSPASQIEWRNQSDRAISRWVSVQRSLRSLAEAIDDRDDLLDDLNKAILEQCTIRQVEAPPPRRLDDYLSPSELEYGYDPDAMWHEAEQNIQRLRSRRIRTSI